MIEWRWFVDVDGGCNMASHHVVARPEPRVIVCWLSKMTLFPDAPNYSPLWCINLSAKRALFLIRSTPPRLCWFPNLLVVQWSEYLYPIPFSIECMVFMYLCEFFKVYIFGEMVNVFCVPPNRTVMTYIFLPVLLNDPESLRFVRGYRDAIWYMGWSLWTIIEFIKK